MQKNPCTVHVSHRAKNHLNQMKLETENLKPETCNCAQRPGLAEEEALKKEMEEKSKEFAEKGSELYAKA